MHRPDQAHLVAAVVDSFPKMKEQEQKTSLGLYRALAEGNPVTRQHLATLLKVPPVSVYDALNQRCDVRFQRPRTHHRLLWPFVKEVAILSSFSIRHARRATASTPT